MTRERVGIDEQERRKWEQIRSRRFNERRVTSPERQVPLVRNG